MKVIKKVACVLLAIITTAGLMSGCNSDTSKVETADQAPTTIKEEMGKIVCETRSLVYNADGSLSVTVSVTNNSKFAKVIKTVSISYINDSEGTTIIKDGEFTLDTQTISQPGGSNLIECSFESSQVLFKSSKTDKVTSEISLTMDSCVYNAAAAESTDEECFTISVTQAIFDTTGGLDGKLSIRNNYNSSKTLKSITFNLIDTEGNKVNNGAIIKDINQTLSPDEAIVQSFSIIATELTDAYSGGGLHAFDTLDIKCQYSFE